MKRLVVIIIIAVIAGKLFATAVVRFAKNSDLTSKTLVHRLFLDKSTEDKMKMSEVPANLKIAKPIARPIARQSFPFVPKMKRRSIQPIATVKVAKTEEKAIEEKAKADQKAEDERRKKRRKSLEEKANAIAAQPNAAPPAPFYYPQVPQETIYPTAIMYVPGPKVPPQNINNPVAPQPVVPRAVGAIVSNLSNSNISSWTKILVENPTPPLISTFEGLYKTHQIDETQYYQVLTAMTASTNSESRNFGVQAAALYQNINSFKILADESVTETNTTIRAQAAADVQAYAVAADDSILQMAKASGDPNEVAVATRLLGTATPPTVAAN